MATTTHVLAGARAGAGEPVLLLHGIGTTHADLRGLADLLAADHDVLALDLPGHGGSPPLDRPHTAPALADAVAAELDARGLPTVHAVGNSLGGRVALELARAGRARSVVALAPSGLAWAPERLHQLALIGGARLGVRAIGPLVPALSRVPAGRAALLAAMRARPWAATRGEALALGEGLGGSARFWETLWLAGLDVPAPFDGIACPVTLVQGVLDAVAPGQAPRYRALIPGARVEWIADAGHAQHGDRPDEVARIVRETIARAADRPPVRPRTSRSAPR